MKLRFGLIDIKIKWQQKDMNLLINLIRNSKKKMFLKHFWMMLIYEISEFIKKETTNVLEKVLYTASLKMKNAFSRSDA